MTRPWKSRLLPSFVLGFGLDVIEAEGCTMVLVLLEVSETLEQI